MSRPVQPGYPPVGYGPAWGQPDPARAFFAGRSRRMVGALLVAFLGIAPLLLMVLPLATAMSTTGVHWATWTVVGAGVVLWVAAVLLGQMNNQYVLREPAATRYAQWTVRVGATVGGVGVAASAVALWAGRTQGWQEMWRSRGLGDLAWWSVTVAPGLVLVGTVLVLWLGDATLRGLRAAPAGLLEAQAAERDLVWLRKAFDPGWRTRMRVVIAVLATLLGLLGVGGLVVAVASDAVVQLTLVAVFLLVMAGACAAYAALDVRASQAVRRVVRAGVTLGVGALGLIVSLVVVTATGGRPTDGVSPLFNVFLLVSGILAGYVEAVARAVGRARRGVLGPEVAAWVAAQDATRAGTLHR